MQSKIKVVCLTVIFIMATSIGLKAQDKYDFATITYSTAAEKLTTSYSNNTVETVKINVKEFDGLLDQRAALIKVAELQKVGWENFNVGTLINESWPIYIFYMRKKQ